MTLCTGIPSGGGSFRSVHDYCLTHWYTGLLLACKFCHFTQDVSSYREYLLPHESSKLGTLGTLQNGTTSWDNGWDADFTEDNSIIICGVTSGSFGGLNIGDRDLVVIKLSSDGDFLWAWQVG